MRKSEDSLAHSCRMMLASWARSCGSSTTAITGLNAAPGCGSAVAEAMDEARESLGMAELVGEETT